MLLKFQFAFLCCLLFYINTAFAVVYTEKPADFISRVEVSACFLEQNDLFLFMHRQDAKSQGNTWGIPGGKVEKTESALEAVIREVKEETGITLESDDVRHIQTVYITNAENNFSYIYHMYTATYDGSLAISIDPQEHKGFTWLTLSDALKMNLMDDEDPCIKLAYPKRLVTSN